MVEKFAWKVSQKHKKPEVKKDAAVVSVSENVSSVRLILQNAIRMNRSDFHEAKWKWKLF